MQNKQIWLTRLGAASRGWDGGREQQKLRGRAGPCIRALFFTMS